MNDILPQIQKLCPHPLYEVGFASLAGLLQPEFARYPYGLSLARKLDQAIIDSIAQGPNSAYRDLYHSVNKELNQKTEEICVLLKAHGIDALPIPATVDNSKRDEKYQQTLRYYFSHKMTATRAGTGWIGKTDLLVTRRFGPRVRLASILLAVAITEPGTPCTASQCGACDICVKKCPAQAATGQLWHAGLDRDEFYHPFQCREFCRKISAENLHQDMTLCGICVAVCPRGKKTGENEF